MIRKARNLDMSAMDPTPEQIRQRSKAIRKAWSPRERHRRANFKRISWLPPVIAETELPGLSPSDFDS
jgi:hypothetical protein